MRIGLVAALVLAAPPSSNAPFVVHEWGTFTTFQDARGVTLEGLQHETERLPDFVYSRTESRPSPFAELGDTSYDEVLPRPHGRMQVEVELPRPPSKPEIETRTPVAVATPASRWENGISQRCHVFEGKCEGCERGACEEPTHCHVALGLSWTGDGAGWHHEHAGACPREVTMTVEGSEVTITAPGPCRAGTCEWIRTGRCGDGYRCCNVAGHDHARESACVGTGCARERLQRVRGKMETPVIYFHTDQAREVHVRVDFTGGLLSQWYPRESSATPAFTTGDLSQIERSSLEWELELVPASRSLPKMPLVGKDDPWQYARDVASAGVRAGGEEERYVFYRGLGSTPPAVVVNAWGRGVAMARNTQVHEIPAAYAVEMTPAGGRFVFLGSLGAGESVEYDLSRAPLLPKADAVAALESEVRRALLEQGLYEDEARAMIRTWSETWFGAEGTRIVLLLPRPAIDAMIPLSIEPAPDALVRVMVGRIEYSTPESEAALAAELADYPRSAPRLARRGRFLEAAVRAVQSEDPKVKAGAAAVLRAYR